MARRLPGSTVEEKLRLNHVLDGGCWRWTRAHTPKGYGHLNVGERRRAVHQLAYEIWVGPIPSGLEIDHICHVRDCINPAHLEAVTHAENLRRMRARRTHCRHGHELTADNIKMRGNGRGKKKVAICRRCYNDMQNRSRAQKKAAQAHG